MLKRASLAVISVLAIALFLTACSPTDHINASGEAAKSALTKVLDKSIAEFESTGGSETISIDSGQYALIYDPKAPEGKRVVTADISDKNSPAFAAEKSIMLRAMPGLIGSKGLENATYNLTEGVFTITAEAISITIKTRDDLVITTTMIAESAGSAGKQVIMTTYGISKEAQAIYDAAK